MELIVSSLKAHVGVSNLFYFVDNGAYVELPGQSDVAKAKFQKIIDFLKTAGIPFHEEIPPTTRAVFLGWVFDTTLMTVSILDERKAWIEEQFQCAREVDSSRLSSIVGVFEFLATVLVFLKAPLGWLRHRQVESERGDLVIDGPFQGRFIAYLTYVKRLLSEWNGSVPIVPLSPDSNCIIFVDASGTVGRGAICERSREFAWASWSSCELASASRKKGVSSAGLELLNAANAVCTFAKAGDSVVVYSDSSAAVAIGNKKYSRSDEDQWALICLDRFCLDEGIQVKFEHLPRENEWIQACDILSKGGTPMILSQWTEVSFRKFPLRPF